MFGLDLTVIAFAILAAFAAGGLAYVFLFQSVENENKRDQRIKTVQGSVDKNAVRAAQNRQIELNKRRKNVQDTLKQLEEKQKKGQKKAGLKELVFQSGLGISMGNFYMFSVISGLALTVIAFLFTGHLYTTIAAFFAGTFGLPRWFLIRARKKRINKFTNEFPNAVDVIVRGVKAGLPLNDCIGIVASEAKEPVASEFKRVLEQQHLGIPLGEAVGKLNESMPTAEANFFGIVIAIQQGAGGNLSEALGNLSGVLRDRKKMKAKIQAMSAEAKASGMIIGALPVIVAVLVYLTTPDYIMILFTDETGNLILAGAAVWMSMGIFVMKQMINFDF